MQEKLKRILNTGKATLGSRAAVNDAVNSRSKLIIVASNCPKTTRESIEKYSKLNKIPVLEFDGTSMELGQFCGKPFLVAAMSVTDAGEIDIKEMVKEEKK